MILTDIFIVMKKINILIFLTLLITFSINSEDITGSMANIYSSPSIITDIKALATENSIEITFSNSEIDRELVIYRSKNPITSYNDLLKASLITTFYSDNNIFIDYPLEGIPYFYLIMDSLLTKSGEYVIEQNENVTSNSILIQGKNSFKKIESRETLRNQPLPYLDLKSSIESGKYLSDNYSELPEQQILTFESQLIINSLLKNIFIESKIDLEPVIFDSDISTSTNSEEYQLKRILESDFKNKNWTAANYLLRNFLSVEHSSAVEIRAHFYLAQILFFQNKYTESFMEFTLVQEDLPSATRPWMDTIFTYLQEDN